MAQSESEVGGHPGFRIRTIFLASALSTFASAAFAQYAAPGGFGSYTIDAQAAAAASAGASAGNSDANGGRCYLESRGRGGAQYQCDDQTSVAPRK